MPTKWTVDPREFIPEFVGKHSKLCEEVAIEIYAGVIQRTPVDTGNLRASWNIAEGREDLTIVVGGSVRNPLPPPKIPTTLGKLPDYPIINVTNSQPYADVVENGGPHNEPRKMVALTLESLKP